jgi:hypothetical protein
MPNLFFATTTVADYKNTSGKDAGIFALRIGHRLPRNYARRDVLSTTAGSISGREGIAE